MASGGVRYTEKDLQRSVMDYARANRWRVAHHHDSRRQVRPGVHVGDRDAAGMPDLMLVRDDRLVFVELKSEHGKLTVNQQQWIDALEQTAAEVYTWRPGDWREVETTLGGGR